jgi:3-hydroxymyristoyl/3-hydroxydecanoyl-(acyl carrier protein) dehydratase
MGETLNNPPSLPLMQAAIQRLLPHRYPFLLVDRVTEFVPGERIAAMKRFSINDDACQGYQSAAALVPLGVVLETVTQLGAVLVLERPAMAGKVALILQIPMARLLRPVAAGDTLRVEAEVIKMGERFGELRGTASREGELIAEGQMRFAIADAAAVGLGKSQQSTVGS